MFAILFWLCLVIVVGTLIRGYFTGAKFEHFDLLLSTSPARFVQRYTIDDATRHVQFNRAGGIMTISMRPPVSSEKIDCPDFIDESVTLGKNNVCWLSRS